ncbi:MAG TPA: hypothetical protein VGL29_00495, partial [Blastocatellia bacterium]
YREAHLPRKHRVFSLLARLTGGIVTRILCCVLVKGRAYSTAVAAGKQSLHPVDQDIVNAVRR